MMTSLRLRAVHRPVLASLTLIGALTLSACGTSQPIARDADASRQALGHMGPVSALSHRDAATASLVDAALQAERDAERAESGPVLGAPNDPLRPEATIDIDDTQAAQDLWARIRAGYALPELESELVEHHERWYSSRPDYVQRMTQRASRYLFHIVEEVSKRDMPAELALLPFIESAFNPQAVSSARASGMWQFMPATGKDFELRQNLFRDDRRDVLASTRAALDYLQRLHRMFGDWHLALAAYNWGEGNVQRAIKRNERAGLPTDYLSLSMPLETRHYVPKLHAVRNLIGRPEAYGVTLPPLENHPYFVSVPIQRDMDVTVAARLAGLPLDEFKALNPSQNKPVILAAGTPQVLLPYDNAQLFVHNVARHSGAFATWTAWQVPRTMRTADAAKQVGMSEAQLREVNRIPPKMLVKAGSTLLVPRSETRVHDVSEALAENAMMALAPDLPPLRRTVVKAGKRDTVATIARRYKTSAQQVAQWNHTAPGARFKAGQKIVVYVPVKGQVAKRAVAKHEPAAKGQHVAKASTDKKTKVAAKAPAKKNVRVASNGPRKAAAKSGKARSQGKNVRVASAR